MPRNYQKAGEVDARKATLREFATIHRSNVDTTPVPVEDVKPGERFGLLAVERTFGRDRLRCRCTCGSLAFPDTDDLARGAMRHCGDVRRHGR